jgi:hypothetical protein
MRRRPFTLLRVSLALLVAPIAAWVRSYWTGYDLAVRESIDTEPAVGSAATTSASATAG